MMEWFSLFMASALACYISAKVTWEILEGLRYCAQLNFDDIFVDCLPGGPMPPPGTWPKQSLYDVFMEISDSHARREAARQKLVDDLLDS